MKLKYLFVCLLLCLSYIFTACGSSDNIDYDLSITGFQFRYEMVTNMKSNPQEYKNKTIKLRGDLKNNGSTYYYLTESDNVCCSWKLEVKLKDDSISYPIGNNEDIIVVGNYLTYKMNGVEKYYLQINEFVEKV